MTGPADRHYPRDELIEDARYLAATLEDAHPDPYVGHDGRVHFHRRVEELIREVPDEGEPVSEFYGRAAEIAARVGDGHTGLSAPQPADGEENYSLPIAFRVIGSELYVEGVYKEPCEDLLGGRLLSVEGIPVADLVSRVARVDGADNVIHDRTNLTRAIRAVTPLRYLTDGLVPPVTVTVEKRDGSTAERELAPVDEDPSEAPIAELSTVIVFPETGGEPAYRFLDADHSTALLVVPDMFSYREAHEKLHAMGYERAEELARDAYIDTVGDSPPDVSEAVVAALPSAVEVLTDLVEEMAEAGTDRLVIDTRDNSGGNSLLSHALTYVLHGWDGIEKSGEGHFKVPKDSELYREQIGEDGPIGDTDNPAGFDFGWYFDRSDPDERMARLRDWLSDSPTFAAELERGEYEAYYLPDSVVVVTSATTYSAGAEPAFTLSELGAAVVGVPPSQALNAPRDLLEDELPNTGLDLKTSYRHVESRPGVDGKLFRPDVELTPDRFEAMGRTADAGVRLALEAEGNKEPPPE
jgi:hypothetical protein